MNIVYKKIFKLFIILECFQNLMIINILLKTRIYNLMIGKI